MQFTQENAKKIYSEEKAKYDAYKSLCLNLDMSRGKPNSKQIDVSNAYFDIFQSIPQKLGKSDYRNYGMLDGAPEAKKLFADLSGVTEKEIIVMGNSSLNIMYDMVQRAMQFGVNGELPLNKQEKIKWLCPVPGYDRHFAITELFGIEMINIPMNEEGPDMDEVERLVQDDKVKGIWCVPKFSNPQGIVYSDRVVERFAKLQPKAKDFRVYWDNAYMVHYVTEDVELKNVLEEAKKYGNEDLFYIFGSTSKITFAGAGVAWICASEKNIASIKKYMTIQTIGHDKLTQYAHALFFKDKEGVYKHMEKHAAMLRPKFETVLRILEEEIDGLGKWVEPKGGYFISVDLPEFTAKRTVALAKECGVVLTGAGATYPYKKDPKDSNLRIAPSYPSVEELETAIKVFCCCAKIAWAEKFL